MKGLVMTTVPVLAMQFLAANDAQPESFAEVPVYLEKACEQLSVEEDVQLCLQHVEQWRKDPWKRLENPDSEDGSVSSDGEFEHVNAQGPHFTGGDAAAQDSPLPEEDKTKEIKDAALKQLKSESREITLEGGFKQVMTLEEFWNAYKGFGDKMQEKWTKNYICKENRAAEVHVFGIPVRVRDPLGWNDRRDALRWRQEQSSKPAVFFIFCIPLLLILLYSHRNEERSAREAARQQNMEYDDSETEDEEQGQRVTVNVRSTTNKDKEKKGTVFVKGTPVTGKRA